MGGAYGVAIDPFGGDLLATAALDRLIDADDQRTIRDERGDEQAQQGATDGQARPPRAVEHAVIPLEAAFLLQSHRPQRGGDRPPARREERAEDEVYIVKEGDTLASIAEKTGKTVEELQELNPELDPQALVSGQKIKLRE